VLICRSQQVLRHHIILLSTTTTVVITRRWNGICVDEVKKRLEDFFSNTQKNYI